MHLNTPSRTSIAAGTVNELGRQHKAMHEHMSQMHQQIMDGRGMVMQR